MVRKPGGELPEELREQATVSYGYEMPKRNLLLIVAPSKTTYKFSAAPHQI